MKTKNIEKEFRIEVIASLLENRLLKTRDVNVTEEDLYELSSFISGIDINRSNFYRLGNKVKAILLKLQPELNLRINRTDSTLYDVDIKAILNIYRNFYGNTYKIKSINKCLVKSLDLQDN